MPVVHFCEISDVLSTNCLLRLTHLQWRTDTLVFLTFLTVVGHDCIFKLSFWDKQTKFPLVYYYFDKCKLKWSEFKMGHDYGRRKQDQKSSNLVAPHICLIHPVSKPILSLSSLPGQSSSSYYIVPPSHHLILCSTITQNLLPGILSKIASFTLNPLSLYHALFFFTT